MVPGVGAAPANAQQATGQTAQQTAPSGQALDAAAKAVEGAVRSAMSRAGQPGQPSLGQVEGGRRCRLRSQFNGCGYGEKGIR
ncbi:MAG: hypothetical protein EOM56_13305 [Deltaproteobacteria bacterium]|nr:hypothetical protein [Deltaproteobacteria bacterium]